jgi:hypothetical protein
MFAPADGSVTILTPRQPASDKKVLQACKTEFENNFNLVSFKFNHSLHRSGLFEIPRLVKLARRMIEENGNFRAFDFKCGSIGAKFGDGLDTKAEAMLQGDGLNDMFDHLGDSGTWIKLGQAQHHDPEYAEALDAMTVELEDLSGHPFRKDMTWVSMTLLLASPKIVTPFHIDHETNFLFQIQGSKDVCLFPAADRELVPDPEIERYYSGDFDAVFYREEMQDRGTVYRLTPGDVVHHPSLAPHWVRNDDNISVSVSISYCMKSMEKRARVYQANYFLRKMGLKPLSPGKSPLRDGLKWKLISTLEHRNPKTYSEVLHAPVDRLKSPLKAVKRLVRR